MNKRLKEKTKPSRISNLFHRIVSLDYLPRWVVLLSDIFVATVALVSAYFFARLLPMTMSNIGLNLTQAVVLIIGTQIFFFWLFRTYAGVLRFSNFWDVVKLLMAVSGNTALLFIANFLVFKTNGYFLFPNQGLLMYFVLAFLFLFLVRLTIRVMYDYLMQIGKKSTPVMIYGTKDAAIGIAKMLRSDPETNYKLIGFIDDNKADTRQVIMGQKVYFLNEKNVKNIISKEAKAVIVSPLKIEQRNLREKIDLFIDNNIPILTVPPLDTWQDGALLSAKQLKAIQIEDLLDRPQIELSTENVTKQLESKVVLVTGAAGSIGSEIVRQVLKHNPALIVLLDQAETPMHELCLELEVNYPKQRFIVFLGDVRNKARMEQMMNMYKPHFIFHAAAYKHVPLMEDNPVESIHTNVFGTKTMADLAVKYKVEDFVMISTDKAVNPTNVMGASKRIAEIYVQSLARKIMADKSAPTKFITTRFGNVLGSNGSVIPHFKRQIESGGPVTVTHRDIIRYFMTIPEACMLVLEAGATGKGGEIFIFDMGEPVRIADLAKKMIRLAGYKVDEDIKIVFTGLRPGEKLFEELLNTKETTIATHHPKIMIAKVQEYCYEQVLEMIEELALCSLRYSNFPIVEQMKKIVPEFVSTNSPYESLDVEQK